jgi:hypothetical protein
MVRSPLGGSRLYPPTGSSPEFSDVLITMIRGADFRATRPPHCAPPTSSLITVASKRSVGLELRFQDRVREQERAD